MDIKQFAGSAVLLCVVTLGGCNNSLKNEKAALEEENLNLRTRLADTNGALEAANADRRELEMANTQYRRDIGAMEAQPANQTSATGQRTGFEGISDITTEIGAGEITVTISSDLLFDSGKATLKAAAKRSLDQVASVVNASYPSKQLRIVGHTDSDPIKKSPWKSNYHLGSERAYSVMKYLQSRGVGPERLSIASYGPSLPRGTKADSRRVEIAVILNE